MAILASCSGKAEQTGTDRIPTPPDLTQSPMSEISGRRQEDVGAGLEVSWLISTADHLRIAAALAPYLDDLPPTDPERLRVWGANGLRLIRVPLSDWTKLSVELRFSGATQRQWLGQAAQWTEIVRGPERPRGQIIALDAERLSLDPGRLRLLARCWLSPIVPAQSDSADLADVAAMLNIEIVPQHKEAASRSRESLLGSRGFDPQAAEREEGLLFSRMMLRLSARSAPATPEAGRAGAFAYILIPERPGVDWREITKPRSENDSGTNEQESAETIAPAIGQVVRNGAATPRREGISSSHADSPVGGGPGAGWSGGGGPGAGPVGVLVPTLGEALFGLDRGTFTAEGEERPTPEPAARAIVVLIPRVPSTYQLFAPEWVGQARPAP